MADLPSTFAKVNDVEVAQDAPVTEALTGKLGSNDNYLKDNLDQEILDRDAADQAIISDINTNVKGPGPIQTLTTLRSRLNNAKDIDYLGGTQAFLNPVNSTFLNTLFLTRDSGTFRAEYITGTQSSWSRTSVINTLIPNTTARWAELNVEETGANIAPTVYVWVYSTV